MPYLLPSEQKERIEKAVSDFNETGFLSIYEPCNCGSHVQHNTGGNYHDEIYLKRDSDVVFVKYETTCELVAPTKWQECVDFEAVIRQNADWL